jgi:hypothetical protein
MIEPGRRNFIDEASEPMCSTRSVGTLSSAFAPIGDDVAAVIIPAVVARARTVLHKARRKTGIYEIPQRAPGDHRLNCPHRDGFYLQKIYDGSQLDEWISEDDTLLLGLIETMPGRSPVYHRLCDCRGHFRCRRRATDRSAVTRRRALTLPHNSATGGGPVCQRRLPHGN